MDDKILEYLRRSSVAKSAKEIAKDLYAEPASEVNPALYRMLRTGAVTVNNAKQPPMWSVPREVAVSQRHSDKARIESIANAAGFSQYMSNADNALSLLDAVYKYSIANRDVTLLRDVMTRDNRDKHYSAGYMKMFRQAIYDQQKDITVVVMQGCNYSTDLTADALQTDRNITPFPNEAYSVVMRDLQGLSTSASVEEGYSRDFFTDYLEYRVMTYASSDELMANITLSEDPACLWMVENLTAAAVDKYIDTAAVETSPEQLRVLGDLCDRLLDSGDRYRLRHRVAQVAVDQNYADISRMLLDRSDAIDPEEEERRMALSDIRGAVMLAEAHDLYTQGDVKKLVDTILSLEYENKRSQKQAAAIITGRYRYL